MQWDEHIHQAETVLREAEEDLALAQSDHEMRRVEVAVQIAQAHAMIADTMAKEWR